MPSDAGRPLSDLARKFDDPDLVADAEAVLAKLVPVEREVAAHDGRWFLRRITPYRTTDNRIDGVVVTFVDITRRKHAELEVDAGAGIRREHRRDAARAAAGAERRPDGQRTPTRRSTSTSR